MAFKTLTDYNQERYGGLFRLVNNNDFADVIFLYRKIEDVLVADTHYIKSADYSGYVHCCGRGCPACGKGLKVQTKLFIPLYNIQAGEIQFFDRNTRFENQLVTDVFQKFPNPSDYVFRITRKGEANDINTTYTIQAVGNNTVMSYDSICQKFNASFPAYYSNICREVYPAELSSMLNASSESSSENFTMPDYQVTPRVSSSVVPPVVTPVESAPTFVDVPAAEIPEAAVSDAEPVPTLDSDEVDF